MAGLSSGKGCKDLRLSAPGGDALPTSNIGFKPISQIPKGKRWHAYVAAVNERLAGASDWGY